MQSEPMNPALSTFSSLNRNLRVGRLTLNWPTVLTGAGLFLAFVTLLAAIQFASPNLAGNDGYYHIKVAQVMREQGPVLDFNWLPLTILNAEAFNDHHLLYHILLMPFTFGDLRAGAKWASVIFPALTFLTGWLLLRGQKVPYAPIWVLGFVAISEAFLYRMSMPRRQALSLLLLLLALHLVLTHRSRWLLLVAFLYVWLFDAFLLILMVVGVYVAARFVFDKKIDVAPLAYATGGVILGLIVNPYFPNNVVFIYNHLAPKLTDTTAIKVGNEWYPYRTWTLMTNSGFALLAFVSGIFALGMQERRMNVATATLLTLAVLFGALLFKSRRVVEYFPAFALLFAALAWAPLFKNWKSAPGLMRWAVPLLLTATVVAGIVYNVPRAQNQLQKSKPYQQYADASAWLAQNSPAGSRVFQTDWDDFTRLYFYNTHNTYLVGLDPTYMQLYDAELYDLWVSITKGKVKDPAQVISDTFGSQYVITDLKHKKFLKRADEDPQLEEVFRDDYAVVFQVVK